MPVISQPARRTFPADKTRQIDGFDGAALLQFVGKQLHGVAVAQKTQHGKFAPQALALIFGRQRRRLAIIRSSSAR